MLSFLSLTPLPSIALQALLPNTFASFGTVSAPVPNEFPSFISLEAFDRALSGPNRGNEQEVQENLVPSFLRLTIGSPQTKEKLDQNLSIEVPTSPSTPAGPSSRPKNGRAKRGSVPKVTFSQESGEKYKEANMFLTVFERAKLIATRAAQIANGAQATIITTGMRSSFEIAKKELYDKRFPLKLQRAWPNGRIEVLDPNRMIILDPDVVATPRDIAGIRAITEKQTLSQETDVTLESPREPIRLNDFDDTGFPYPDPEHLSLTHEFLNQIKEARVDILFNSSKSNSVDISMTQEHDRLNMVSTIVQAKPMLRSRLRLGTGPASILLQSVLQVWTTNQSFREEVLAANDKWEILWRLRKNYNYKIPTPFSPLYARSIMDQLAQLMQLERDIRVLDPSSGWGDRLIGSFGARVSEYVGVDPNRDLFGGYAEIMRLYGVTYRVDSESNTYILDGASANKRYRMICAPFESDKAIVPIGHFDVVVTSPPFFDYEVYSETNPTYRDWIRDFYMPYTKKALECLRIGGYMALHIDDTSAGNISDFIDNIPRLFSGVIHRGTIYLKGARSHQTRPVHLFEKLSL